MTAAGTTIPSNSTGIKTFWAKWVYEPDLMVKFGIKDSGYTLNSQNTANVTATFTALHNYITDTARFNKDTRDNTVGNIVHLGDYIDLPSLTVTGTELTGAGNNPATGKPYIEGAISTSNINIVPSTLPFDGYNGRLLRLIVVGINSFNSRTASGYTSTTPHVVFQFQNIPGERRMNVSSNHSNIYTGSQMQNYLKVNFLAGLKTAGVPTDTYLWAPKRPVGSGDAANTSITDITDSLWLPTEWEMFGSRTTDSSYVSSTNEGTGDKQAHLEYYNSNAKRIKYKKPGSTYESYNYYWEVSPRPTSTSNSCLVYPDGSQYAYTANQGVFGVAPAFCVK
jgi:hypothetical protein